MSTELTASSDDLRKKFFELETPQDIAALLEIDYRTLQYHLEQVPSEKKYRIFYIPKRSGGHRMITAPVSPLKIIQSKLNQVLQVVYSPRVSTHGFVIGKSIVTNAQVHTKFTKKWVFNIDLKDFFVSIYPAQVQKLFMATPYNLNETVAETLTKICCFNDSLPQGAPTSPVVSNMICANMDYQLDNLAYECGSTYTRYADDITFSAPVTIEPPKDLIVVDSAKKIKVGSRLEGVVRENGFRINFKKVRLQVTPR